MNINKKVSIFLFLTVLVVVLFLILLIQNRVNNTVILENKFMEKNIKKLYYVFYEKSKYLKTLGYEYKRNKELVKYVNNKNINKLEKYFDSDYMEELSLSHFAIFDKDKNFLYGDSYDISSNEIFDPSNDLIKFIKEKQIAKYIKKTNEINYMTLDYEKAIFHIKALKNEKGDICGYIFFARTIDSNLLLDMSTLMQNYISLIPSYKIKVPKMLIFNEYVNITYEIDRKDEKQLFSYINLFDENSNENFYIRVISSRDLYSEVILSLKTIIIGVSISFLLLIIIFYLFMSKIFTKRIVNITDSVKDVLNNNNLEIQIKTNFNDEITFLANKLNEMFISIDRKQHAQMKNERDFLQSILDTQENILVITSDNSIHSVNKKFKDIFSSYDQFITNIAFIDNSTQESFVSIAKEYSLNEEAVKFKLENSSKYFTFNVSKIDTTRHLISMNDVSIFNEKINSLEDRVYIDALTTVYNKEMMTTIIKESLLDKEFHIALLDIDFFKNVNDTYGHLIGDYILKDMAKRIKNSISNNDYFGRVGGEEFMIIIFEDSKINCINVCNRVRELIQKHLFKYEDLEINITLSIGCAKTIKNDEYEDIYKRADDSLYEAKSTGRNKVIYQKI